MQIWIKQGDTALRLPVNPSSFEVTTSNNNTTVNINSIGEINLLGKSNLKKVTFSSFFPKQKYDFVQYTTFPTPVECVKMLERYKDNPVKLIITWANINMVSTIESFTYSKQDATGDIYYTLEFKEYKKLKSVNIKTKKIAEIERPTKVVKSTTYVAKKNDTVYSAVKKATGSVTATKLKKVAELNDIKLIRKLQPGERIRMLV